MDELFKYVNGNVKADVTLWCQNFQQIWKRSDWIFSMLRSKDDYYKQPTKLQLPLIFYLGHLPCFTWAQFRNLTDQNDVIDATFDQIFLRGVDPDVKTCIVKENYSSRFSTDMEVENIYWRTISVERVTDYKNHVRQKLIHILMHDHLNFNDIHTLNVFHISAEHEMLHHETLMHLYIQLPIESLQLNNMDEFNFVQTKSTSPLAKAEWIQLPGGQTSLGKSYNNAISKYSFGWDNEYPIEPVYVPVFEMQKHPVRNGDFLQFILDNGYTTSDWWDENIFNWIMRLNVRCPVTWTVNNSSFAVNFVLQRNIPIELVLDHPVLVSHVEAKAYCRWLSKKMGEQIDLPSEAEWIYALWDSSDCIDMAVKEITSNIDFRCLHTTPIPSRHDNKLQWHGSVYEWTSSVFRPFTGYRGALPTYPGYSADFFDNKHFLLLGASFATDLTFMRRTFRHWYHDTYRYAFSGFRCVKHINHTDDKLTETDRHAITTELRCQEHRCIPSKYFYDAQGSALYTQITQLDEYYLFEQELKLLYRRANDIKTTIIQHSISQHRSSSMINFIELGCGDGKKVEAWLQPWIKSTNKIPFTYQPVDISQHAIDCLIQLLKQTFDEDAIKEHVKPVCSTFANMFDKLNTINSTGTQVVMLMGSTIGNFSSYDQNNIKYGRDAPVMQLLRLIRENLRIGDWFICAFDVCKKTSTMIRAYSDSKGVTKAFNLNLLARLNRELKFNFNLNNYEHYAFYNPLRRQMESWLICLNHEIVTDERGFTMHLQPYDVIQTELSTKYTQEDIEMLMKESSMKIIECFFSDDQQFPYCLCMAQMA